MDFFGNNRNLRPSLYLLLGVVIGALVSQFLTISRPLPDYVPQEDQGEFRLMAEAWNLINERYFNQTELENRTLTYGAIQGLTSALEDHGHTRFLTPEMQQAHEQTLQGEFEGIGAEVRMVVGKLTIVSPLERSPAAEAGLEPGDIILAVDGEDISGMTLEGAVELIRGPEGSQVQLTIQDEDTGERREVTITRARIEIDQVTWAPIPGTPYAMLRVTAFSEGVSQELEAALIEIQGAGMEAVVLDLRNNSGGLLDEAVGVASEFLAEGDVLIRKDAEDQQQRVAREGDPQAPDLPLVVLANAGTASGAEVVAGALRDNGRALLVGMTTFGAGTVLNQFNLSDGSALLLATEEWLTPMGDRIWQRGIPPDVEVSLPEGGSPLDPDALEEMDAESFRNSQDTQLLRAVELLRTGETS